MLDRLVEDCRVELFSDRERRDERILKSHFVWMTDKLTICSFQTSGKV